MKHDAVLLAGGKLKGSDQNKAFIKLGEQTLLDRAIATFKECPEVGRVIITSAPPGYEPQLAVDELLTDTGDLVQNIANALHKVQSPKVIIAATDVPLMKADHIREFVDLCTKVKADFYYPLIPKSVMGKLGSMKRTYFKLDRTEFTGGNLILLKKEMWEANLDTARDIYVSRKSPLKMAKLVGPLFLIKMLLGRLSVGEVESKTSQILGGLVKGVIVRHPEIGSDIDKQEDLEFMQQFLGVGSE